MLGGLLEAAGSALAGWFGYKGQKDTNQTSINLSREQMEFQERMSNSSYQRAVRDMQAAGLNPMLAYSQGGASAPMGSMPQVQNAVGAGMASASQAASTMQGIAQVVATLASTEKTQAEAEMIRRQTLPDELYKSQGWSNLYRTHEETRRLFTGANLDEANAEVAAVMRRLREIDEKREGASWEADVRKRKAQTTLTEMDIPRAKSEEQFYQSLGQANPWVRMFVEIMKGVRSRGR
jgi:hypothetical protein